MHNNEDDQRFWNMMMFKIPMSDKEVEKATPILLIITVVVLIITLIFKI